MFAHDCRDAEHPPTPRERIAAALASLGPDELEVIATIAERAAMGRRLYGELAIASDRRDLSAEAVEEAADGLFYSAAALVRARREREAGRAPAPAGDC